MYSLLIVDDEETIRRGLTDVCLASDLQFRSVEAAESAVEALSLLEKNPCDILLSDIRMPDMDGLEMVRQAKKIWPDIRVIFLTGYRDFTYAQTALKLGSEDYLVKPVSDEKLLSCLREVVRAMDMDWIKRFQMQQAVGEAADPPDAGEFRKNGEGGRFVLICPDASGARMSEGEIVESLCNMLRAMLRHICTLMPDMSEPGCICVRLSSFEEGVPWKSIVLKILEEIQSFYYEHLDVKMSVGLAELKDGASFDTLMEQWIRVNGGGGKYGSLILLDGEDAKAQESNFAVSSIKKLIREHPEGDLSLGVLAERFHMNPSYLSRIFHQETGRLLTDYILQVRLERARSLLADTQLRIYEVATQAGFGSAGYFNRVFHKAEGLSPKEYRMKRCGSGADAR